MSDTLDIGQCPWLSSDHGGCAISLHVRTSRFCCEQFKHGLFEPGPTNGKLCRGPTGPVLSRSNKWSVVSRTNRACFVQQIAHSGTDRWSVVSRKNRASDGPGPMQVCCVIHKENLSTIQCLCNKIV